MLIMGGIDKPHDPSLPSGPSGDKKRRLSSSSSFGGPANSDTFRPMALVPAEQVTF